VQIDVLILDGVAPDGFGGRIDPMRHVGIDEIAVGIEIDRSDMQGLMQVADEMGEHEQRLFLVPDRERRRCGPVGQHRDRRTDRGHRVVIVGALEASIETVALDRHVLEVKRIVAAAFKSIRRVGAGEPVSLRIIDNPRPLLRGVERRARHFEFEMIGIHFVVKGAVVVPCHALHTIRPRSGGAQIEAENLPHLLFRVRLQQLVGDRADDPVTLIAPRRCRGRIQQTDHTAEHEDNFRHQPSRSIARETVFVKLPL